MDNGITLEELETRLAFLEAEMNSRGKLSNYHIRRYEGRIHELNLLIVYLEKKQKNLKPKSTHTDG